MKKTILTFFIIVLGAAGLYAQSRKADTAATSKSGHKSILYTLNRHDSLMINKSIKDAQLQQEEKLFINESAFPYPGSRRVGTGMNDVIDVGHEIR